MVVKDAQGREVRHTVCEIWFGEDDGFLRLPTLLRPNEAFYKMMLGLRID
jgi:hypothetical protein